MKAKITNLTKLSAVPTSRLVFLIALCCFCLLNTMTFGQNGSYVLGANTPGANHGVGHEYGETPFACVSRGSRNQYLYFGEELNQMGASAGNITSLAFKVTKLPSSLNSDDAKLLHNITIKISLTNKTSLNGTIGPDDPSANITTLSGSYAITETGWVTFQLTSPFRWPGLVSNPKPNILVEICQNSDSKSEFPEETPYNFEVQTSSFEGLNSRVNNNFVTDDNYSDTFTDGCSMDGVNLTLTNNTYTENGAIYKRPDIKFIFDFEPLIEDEDGSLTPNLPISGNTNSSTSLQKCIGDVNILEVTDGDHHSGLVYQWSYSLDGITFSDISGSAAKEKTYVTLKTDADIWYRRNTASIIGSYSVPLLIRQKVWNGSEWRSAGIAVGEPDASETAVIVGDYNIISDKHFCGIIVKSGCVKVASNTNLTLQNGIKVETSGSLTFENSASLIQNNNSATINSGKVTFKRKTTPVRRYDYTYWSSPVVNQNLNEFSPVTRPDKYYSWNHISQTWDFTPPLTTTMTPGKGYIIRAPDDFAISGAGQVWEGSFGGIPNNGIVEVSVSGTVDPSVSSAKWNLIGNPYPSSIDAFKFFDDNSAVIDGTFYVWTHNSSPNSLYSGTYTYNYNINDYASFNKTGSNVGVGTAAGIPTYDEDVAFNPNYTEPGHYIASGQSFMIKGINNGMSQKVIFRNAQRVQNNNSNFYKTNKSTSSKMNSDYKLERSRVWLEYINEKGGFKQLLVGYLDGATNEYDNGYDGDIMDGEGVTFFSIIKDHQLGIQGKGLPFENSDTIPLGYSATVAGNNAIALVNYDGLFKDQDIYLEDTYLNIIHNLKSGNYTFVSTIGTFLNRFILRYKENTLNLPSNTLITSTVIAFNKSGNLVVNSQNINIASVKVYDLSGRLVMQKNNCNSDSLIFENLNWNAQLMLVKIKTLDKVEVTRKVLF